MNILIARVLSQNHQSRLRLSIPPTRCPHPSVHVQHDNRHLYFSCHPTEADCGNEAHAHAVIVHCCREVGRSIPSNFTEHLCAI